MPETLLDRGKLLYDGFYYFKGVGSAITSFTVPNRWYSSILGFFWTAIFFRTASFSGQQFSPDSNFFPAGNFFLDDNNFISGRRICSVPWTIHVPDGWSWILICG